MSGVLASPEEIVAGNVYPKYTSRNPLARLLVENFTTNLRQLARRTGARQIHEVGCGEGFLSRLLATDGFQIRGSDLSGRTIDEARRRSADVGADITFSIADLYELEPQQDSAELVVCCEVLEHLPDPERALETLAKLACPYLIASVPREPMWRALNMARGRYWSDLGNTPGHLQHWSSWGFKRLLDSHFDLIEVRNPLPWTMVLCRARSSQ